MSYPQVTTLRGDVYVMTESLLTKRTPAEARALALELMKSAQQADGMDFWMPRTPLMLQEVIHMKGAVYF